MEPAKPKRHNEKPLTLYPMTFDEALDRALAYKPKKTVKETATKPVKVKPKP